MELEWEKYCDEWGNAFWKAKAEYSYYVIRPTLRENKIMYYEDSAPELRITKHAAYPEIWYDIESAKSDIWKIHKSLTNKNDTTRSL